MHWSKSNGGTGGIMLSGTLVLLSGCFLLSGAERANRQPVSFSYANESFGSILGTGTTLDQLPTGRIALSAPSTMNLGRTYSVALVLSATEHAEELLSSVSRIAGFGQFETADVKYSLHMDTQLTGPNFDIKGSTPAIQTTTSQDESQWLWDVVPTQSGMQSLHFILHANLDRGGSTVERTVQVQVRDFQ
jgi:hypothetical protein